MKLISPKEYRKQHDIELPKEYQTVVDNWVALLAVFYLLLGLMLGLVLR